MPWISSAISAGGSLLGGLFGDETSSNAADAGVASAQAGIDEQRRQFDLNRSDQARYMQTGNAANARLAFLMGLGGGGGAGGGAGTGSAPGGIKAPPTTWQAGQSGDPLWEEILENFNAVHTAQYGSPLNREWGADADSQAVYDRLAAEYMARSPAQSPTAGAPNPASDPAYGSLERRFSQADLETDPVYNNGLKFGLDQGTGAINARAMQSGNYDSGQTLKALTRYANDYGTTKAEGAYNRFNTDNTNTYNRLAGLSGAGQTATNQVATAGANAANQISGLQTDAGTARAAGIVGSGNAWGNAISGVTNAGTAYLKSLMNGGGSGNGNGGFSYEGTPYNNPSAFIAG